MISLTSVNTILDVFKSIKEAAESIVSLRDETLVMGKVGEINSKLIVAQNGIFAVNEERSALVQRVSALEKELASLKAWEAEKQRYVLVEIALGVVAYAIRDDMRGTEPFHYLCANCFSDGKKAFLQQRISVGIDWINTNAMYAAMN